MGGLKVETYLKNHGFWSIFYAFYIENYNGEIGDLDFETTHSQPQVMKSFLVKNPFEYHTNPARIQHLGSFGALFEVRGVFEFVLPTLRYEFQ